MRRLAFAAAAAAGGLLFVALLYRLSLGSRVHGAEACVAFRGRESCGRAWAPTRAEAERMAADNACGTIARGVGQRMACRQQVPTRVRALDTPAAGTAP